MNSERTHQLQLSVFGQLESNKKWPIVGHNTGACLLSSFCLLTAALLMNLGSSSIPLKPNEAAGRHSVAMTVLHYTTSLPGPIYFPAVQTSPGEKNNCEVRVRSRLPIQQVTNFLPAACLVD